MSLDCVLSSSSPIRFGMTSTQEFLDELTNAAVESGEVEILSRCGNAVDKVKACLENTTIKTLIDSWIRKFTENPRSVKCDKRAHEFRERGNRYFRKDYPLDSLPFYSSAIRNAVYESYEQRLSYGNRSAVFYHMGEYELCLKDIELALEERKCPERLTKLFVRKGKALTQLKKFDEALVEFDAAKRMLATLTDTMNEDLFLKKFNYYKNEINGGLEQLRNLKNKADRNEDDDEEEEEEDDMEPIPCEPVLSYGANPDFPSASVAVELRETREKGRHVVAKQRIKQGDTLFVEKPYAFVILPLGVDHCHYCCKKVLNPLPCYHCSVAEYCNEECRVKGWETFHKWECGGGIDLCHSFGIAHLSLRLVMIAANNENNPETEYHRVQSLLSHLDKLNPQDLYQYTLTASILVTYLELSTDFFQDKDKDHVFKIGGAILEHIGQLICNGHSITALQPIGEGDDQDSDVYDESVIRVATAIYPSASMMNHSCDHNIMHSFYGQYLVVKASRTIEEGEEIFNCYGPHYRRMEPEERQRLLWEQYRFKCDCKPCTDPMYKNFLMKFSAFLCPHCMGPAIFHSGREPQLFHVCLQCDRIIQYANSTQLNVIKGDTAYKTGEAQMLGGDYRSAVQSFLKALFYRKLVYYNRHEGIRNCLDKVARCYAILNEYAKSFEFIEQTLMSLDDQFGDCSPEMAHELTKLCEASVKIIERTPPHNTGPIIRKAYRYTEKTKIIVEILFGKWSKEYQEIYRIGYALQTFSEYFFG